MCNNSGIFDNNNIHYGNCRAIIIRDNKIVGNIIGAMDEASVEDTFEKEGFKK